MRSLRFPVLLLTAPICALALLPATTIAAEKFDGQWLATQDCPAKGKMEELIRKIPVVIQNNSLKGDKGTPGDPGYEIIQGQIAENGDAKLTVDGVLANRANAHGFFAHKGEEYNYTVKAHFDEAQGKGTRDTGLGVESRPCDFTFVKQDAATPPAPAPASAPQ
jgi:hypothetical protein